ncbi:unnamed protein product [Miscanthus lutarioriparius]|uniref:AAA+ ATPase domain-containing protein n=1 Tax=Miscanthus lutarioriparius TaxID=422564 RepID=A0A811PTE6_9POAL|nr:unnamed protein product [Miscanthus lutarioriparius]
MVVVADPVLSSMASSLTTFFANLVLAEISEHRAVKGDVNRLKTNYERVALMMESAERKVMLDDEVARYWLKRVKDHMYQVENVVDHWIIKNEKKHRGSHRRSLSCGDCSDNRKLAAAIKELNVDFESILKLKDETKTDQHAIRSYGKTASDYNADIIGDYVDSDASDIIELLHSSKKRCRLIAIVGMVGIGKTTLARRIYHRVKVGDGNDQHFEIKLWIRFSNDLSSLIMWSDCRKEGSTNAQLQNLGAEIANKKFLLVVDSVWTENVWEALLEGPLLQGNCESSRVILTTRNKHIAKRIGAGHIHYVKRMNNIDALSLLFRRASISENDEADLKDIGQQIVKKCDGLPLAIRSIGRTLRSHEPTRHDWETVYRTAFQDLSPEEQYMINLSFQNLPSYMRQCFLYYSVFPEDFFIEKQYIIQQWISEGFIVEKRKLTMEEVAEYYFDELIGRGLLHLEFGNAGAIGAKMPIMIRSFAKDVSDHENFCNESMSTTNIFEARRLSIVKNNEADKHNDDSNENGDNGGIIGGEENINENKANNGHLNNDEAKKDAKSGESASLHGLKRMKYLRTLVLHKSTVPDGIRVDTFKQLNLLRVLDLREVRGIEVLPIAVGSLERLRYLNISQTKIKRVPRSIVDLKMLQYFLLRNCSQIETLPKGTGTKTFELKELELCYINVDPTLVQDKKMDKRMEVLDKFDPHKCLVHLKIENYYGMQYPSWISTLSNLQRLHLQNCVWCEKLPSLGELPQLKFLAVTGFARLCSLGMEFRGDLQDKVAFRRLQLLFIGGMEALHTWSDLKSQDLPQLQVLSLLGCIKLTAIPLILQKSTTLTRLEVDTRTKIGIEDKLQGFTKGKVINMDNTWEPQRDESFEALVALPNAYPPQQDEIVEAAETQNAQPPQQDEIIEAVTSQNAHPSPQDQIIEAKVAPQNERPGRFKLDWKKAMLSSLLSLHFCYCSSSLLRPYRI